MHLNKHHNTAICLFVILLFCSVKELLASETPSQPEGWVNGSGGQISSLEELNWLSQTSEAWDEAWVLTSDIDASETRAWNFDGTQFLGFQPIGNSSDAFSGSLSANGHRIKNLYINNDKYSGLFGATFKAQISNLHLQDAFVLAGEQSGILVGYSVLGTVSDCSTSGEIRGGNYTGGLVGKNNQTVIERCMSAAHVEGDNYVGGLIGTFTGLLKNSYAVGSVNGTDNCAGLVGESYGGEIRFCCASGFIKSEKKAAGIISTNKNMVFEKCYFDYETMNVTSAFGESGQTSDEVTGLTADAFFQESSFLGWDFSVGTQSNPWLKAEGSRPYLYFEKSKVQTTKLLNYDLTISAFEVGEEIEEIGIRVRYLGKDNWTYTALSTEAFNFVYSLEKLEAFNDYWIQPYVRLAGDVLYFGDEIRFIPLFDGGFGTEEQPYLVNSLATLIEVANRADFWDAHFSLTTSLDAESTKSLNDGQGFKPIGNKTVPFSGVFYGNGNTINKLFINRIADNYIGLFAYADSALIHNLHLNNSEITGNNFTGGLVGYMSSSTVEGCSYDGDVIGNDQVGGLVGMSYRLSTIRNSSFDGYMEGGKLIGGIVGVNEAQALVENCYSLGEIVASRERVGGIAGYSFSFSEILHCFSDADVTGDRFYVGGLVGVNEESVIKECFTNGDVIGKSFFVGGIVGKNSRFANLKSCYSMGRVEGESQSGGLVGENHSSIIVNCYYDRQATAQESAIGTDNFAQEVISYGTEDFELASNFSLFDFKNVWEISTIESITRTPRPYLKWQLYNNKIHLTSNKYKVGELAAPLAANTGDEVELKVSTKNGFKFMAWVINGDTISKSNPYSLSLTKDTTLNIEAFVIEDYQFAGGDGAVSSPFQISTLKHLEYLSNVTSIWDKHFMLIQSIDASSVEETDDGSGFSPIGDLQLPFTGSFNGNDFSIENLTIYRPSQSYVGLFGYTSNVDIENIKLDSVSIVGNRYTGALIGYSDNDKNSNHSIVNCHVNGAVRGESNFVGGLTGFAREVLYDNCSVNGSVEGSSFYDHSFYIAGLIGWLSHGAVNNSSTHCNINAVGRDIGGFVGNSVASTITNSYATGPVNGGGRVGGFAGENSYESTIDNCYATGDVISGEVYSGGLVGYNQSSAILNSYATGNVKGVSAGGLSGVISYSKIGGDYFGSLVQNSFASGFVYGNELSGALIGEAENSQVLNCWANGAVWCSQSYVGGLIGKATTNSDIVLPCEIQNCYSSGSVRGALFVGGAIGSVTNVVYSGVYYDEKNATIHDFGKGYGLSESEFKSAITFPDFNFGNSFSAPWVENDKSRPFLYNQLAQVSTSGISYTSDTSFVVLGGRVDNWNSSSPLTEYGYSIKEGLEGDWHVLDNRKTNLVTGAGLNILPYTVEDVEEGIYFVRSYSMDSDSNYFYGDMLMVSTLKRYGGGIGSENQPYKIENYDHLVLLSETPEDWSKNFIQTENIDASFSRSAAEDLGERSKFIPIGRDANTPFAGRYDGLEHTIEGLYVNGEELENAGFIGVAYNANISNLGLVDAEVNGVENVGLLIGKSVFNTIEGVFTKGDVSGDNNVGGFIGCDSISNLKQCFSYGNVTGTSNVGGLIGYAIQDTLEQVYSASVLSKVSSAGGLVGLADDALINNSYYDVTYAGINDTGKGAPLVTESFVQESSFYNWDFESVWKIDLLPYMDSNNQRPYLKWQTIPYQVKYLTSGYGNILGSSQQNIFKGNLTENATAIPNPGNTFVQWESQDGAKISTLPAIVLTNVLSDTTLVARFKEDKYNVRFNHTDKGTLSGDTLQILTYNQETAEVEAIPDADFHFLQWETIDGDSITNDNPLVLEDVQSDSTVVARFGIRYLHFYKKVEGNGRIVVDKFSAIFGETVTYTVLADSGYIADSIIFNTFNVTPELYDNQLVVYNPTTDGYLTAYFSELTSEKLDSTEQEKIKVYPNPASDEFTLEIPDFATVSIYSSAGHLVDRRHFRLKDIIDLKKFGLGTYYIQINTGRRLYYREVIIR